MPRPEDPAAPRSTEPSSPPPPLPPAGNPANGPDSRTDPAWDWMKPDPSAAGPSGATYSPPPAYAPPAWAADPLTTSKADDGFGAEPLPPAVPSRGGAEMPRLPPPIPNPSSATGAPLSGAVSPWDIAPPKALWDHVPHAPPAPVPPAPEVAVVPAPLPPEPAPAAIPAPAPPVAPAAPADKPRTLSPGRHSAKAPPPNPNAGKRDALRIDFGFPNGMAGRPFRGKLEARIEPESRGMKVEPQRVHLPEPLLLAGMTVEEGLILTGTPAAAGEYVVPVDYRLTVPDLEPQDCRKELRWTVNPDPQALWNVEVEPAGDLPFAKPHVAARREVSPAGSILLAGSRRGRSHARGGSFREDDFRLEHRPASGWHLLIVSDGAGSAKLSRRGSDLLCETVRAELGPALEQHFSPDNIAKLESIQPDSTTRNVNAAQGIRTLLYQALVGAAHKGHVALRDEAKRLGEEPKSLAATLLIGVARRFRFGWLVGSFSIGDGGIGLLKAGSELKLLSRGDSGEFAGQTRFVTMDSIWRDSNDLAGRINYTLVDEFTCLAVMSDGITDPLFETDAGLEDLRRWDAFWTDLKATVDPADPAAPDRVLEWLKFYSPGNHDDRTLALLLPGGG